MSQGSRPAVPDNTAVIDDLLEFDGGFLPAPCPEISIAANVRGIKTVGIDGKQHPSKFDRRHTLRVIQDVSWVFSAYRQLRPNRAQPKRLHLCIQGEPT